MEQCLFRVYVPYRRLSNYAGRWKGHPIATISGPRPVTIGDYLLGHSGVDLVFAGDVHRHRRATGYLDFIGNACSACLFESTMTKRRTAFVLSKVKKFLMKVILGKPHGAKITP